MSQTDSSSTIPAPTLHGTKFCHIIKRPDFDGYGFSLYSEKLKPGQFISKVDVNSPAFVAGLKEGDRIVEVNGEPIAGEVHKQVVQRIKAYSNEVRLLLINADKFVYKNNEYETAIPTADVDFETTDIKREEKSNSTKFSNFSFLRKSDGINENRCDVNYSSEGSNTIQNTSSRKEMVQVSSAVSPNRVSEASVIVKGELLKRNEKEEQLPSIYLPMTAEEMRARLMLRKKYDPKNDNVDLKQKYEILQTL